MQVFLSTQCIQQMDRSLPGEARSAKRILQAGGGASTGGRHALEEAGPAAAAEWFEGVVQSCFS